MYKKKLNELYTEEGFDVLDFNTFSLLERHGVLSGENSCSKFASHLMDFMEVLDKQGINKGCFIVHSNEYSQEHLINKNQGIPDLSNTEWDLPDWASWELVVHLGKYDSDDLTEASMGVYDTLAAHLNIKNGEYLKNKGNRISYSATIQHEMKHYFDKVQKFALSGENNSTLTREVNKLFRLVDEMDDSNPKKKLADYFSYFFYSTSDNEMSAWLEQSREKGIWARLMKDTKFKDLCEGKHTLYNRYKQIIESILLWKDDETQFDKINKVLDLGDIKTYDDFKKFMTDNYGTYMSLRFNQKASFEKYMKGYLKVLDKQIKKHAKIWADGYQGVDLDEDPKDIKDILIKKREERLERIRKKKEGKK